MNPFVEWIAAFIIIVFGTTLIYLIKAVGKYGDREINTIVGVIALVYNPLNWIRLYRIFFTISDPENSLTLKIRRILYLNLAAIVCMVLILAYIIPRQ